MQKILWITLFILAAALCISSMVANQRGIKIKEQDKKICGLETTLAEFKKIQEVYAEAEKEAKEFERELAKDENDNLDYVPSNYILEQLHAD